MYDRTFFWRTVLRASARTGKWKYLNDSGEEHLFDLSVDPGEKNDLSTTQPAQFNEIKQKYLAWEAKMLPRPRSRS